MNRAKRALVRSALLLALLASGFLPSRAGSQPSPLDSGLWAFPGAATAPASGISAARALSDRWLGEQPFDNPAAAPARGVVAAGVLERLSRQDLRSDNRHFEEQAAFIDLGGAWIAMPIGAFWLTPYVYQPLLR